MIGKVAGLHHQLQQHCRPHCSVHDDSWPRRLQESPGSTPTMPAGNSVRKPWIVSYAVVVLVVRIVVQLGPRSVLSPSKAASPGGPLVVAVVKLMVVVKLQEPRHPW